MKQERVVTLTVLTFIIFGLTSLLSQGSFIAPVPFVGEFTAFLCFGLFVEGILLKASKIELALVLSFGLFSLLASPFTFEVILDFIHQNELHSTSYFDYMRLMLEGLLLILVLRLITSLKNVYLTIGLSIFLLGEAFYTIYPDMIYHFLVKGLLGLFLLVYHFFTESKKGNALIEFALKGYGLLHLVAFVSMLIG